MANKVTSLADLSKYAKGTIIELPAFANGQPFFARLRRPSMLALAKSGKIPNELLLTANGLFSGKGLNEEDEFAMKDVWGVIDTICEACFIEPSYAEIQKVIELTDEQMMFIFNYSQAGVRALEPFRKEPTNYIDNQSSATVQENSI